MLKTIQVIKDDPQNSTNCINLFYDNNFFEDIETFCRRITLLLKANEDATDGRESKNAEETPDTIQIQGSWSDTDDYVIVAAQSCLPGALCAS